MIERIQTLLLALVFLCMAGVLFFPAWKKENPGKKELTVINAYEMKYEKESNILKKVSLFYVGGLAVLIGLIAVFSIFQYKKRVFQLKLGLFNSLLLSALLVLLVFQIMKGEETFPEPKYGKYLTGFYLPIAALIINLIANRFIRRDEELVRSADRMR